MTRRRVFLGCTPVCLGLMIYVHLSFGAGSLSFVEMVRTLTRLEADSYEDAIFLYQRLPRVLIAIYVGVVTASSGVVLQALVRNPLASPSTLGVNAGAILFVVAGAFVFNLGVAGQGAAALAGAVTGFLSCLGVARLAGQRNDPRGLALILSGALVSMLLVGVTNAFLMSDPVRRNEFLSWVTGNINQVYVDRLAAFWWIGALAVCVLLLLARPLTLILIGAEKAASAGVNVKSISRLAIIASVLGSGSAVAICGPIGFIGLIVPHLVRPFVGNNLVFALPACALTGATVCLLADLGAREAFSPYVLNTGLVMDLIGGVIFVVIVKRFYLAPTAGGLA